MNINKKLLTITLLATAVWSNKNLLSMQKEIETNQNIIPNASYLIYEDVDANEAIGGVPTSSKNVTFYTFDGNIITTKPLAHYNFSFPLITGKLDPNAPKPQPTLCKIKYWPAIPIGFGMRKGVPGWFIVFYDKNGNRIESYRYDKEKQEITVVHHKEGNETYLFDKNSPSSIDKNFPMDLSIIEPENVIEEARQQDSKGKCTIL